MTLSVLGLFLNAKKNILCWPLWILGNITWIWYFIPNEIPALILNGVFFLVNIYGWIEWSKNGQAVEDKL